jgi:hypothetical protein
MGAGLHGLNGLNPATSMHLISIFILPRLLYGLECLVISSQDIKPLEIYFRGLLQRIQHLPDSTTNAACYLLLGAIPFEAHLHIKTLALLGSIMQRSGLLEHQLCVRQLAIKGSTSSRWFIHAKKLLEMYDLYQPQPSC